MSGGIQFNAGQSMNVEKLYKVNIKDEKEALNIIRDKLYGPGVPHEKDNSDYVVFKKEDTLYIAVGKGDLRGNDRNVDLGLDDDIKFKLDGKEYTAIDIVDKPNTESEIKAYSSTGNKVKLLACGTFIGALAGASFVKNASLGAKLGSIIGTAIAAGGIAIDGNIEKNNQLKATHAASDYLAKKGIITEIK